ncbi:Hef nuclease [Anaerohalosphaera lusitana]|uniref:Hef nuclease n=1 Tax=Anaerohalosphaera lusitana TaxID=1936003 RepID=A0A1U9NPG1_9BACT|nr:DNA-processing protein DprA [Anaerohalosphaera lusitana]AQT69687.1 Hef nuclease [Anaerohalosphaera lusitana]
MNHSEGVENWLRLVRADGVGPKTFIRLRKHFGTVEDVLGASVHQLTKVEGVGPKTANAIRGSIDNFNAGKELELADKLGVTVITIDDARYPMALKETYDPPPVLYVKGEFARSDSLAVAIVGSRGCSIYGKEQAERFAHVLASSGFTIVSGLARGIDTAAHRGALAAGGRTIAVQGCGLGNVFPPENRKLFELICGRASDGNKKTYVGDANGPGGGNGAVISELPLGFEPLSQNFPARNRIIAGLVMGVIVIEAAARSGALITAKQALTNNREVMAVPGRIDSPRSKGSNGLIKEGARLVDSVEDVMETLGYVGEGLKGHVSACETKTKGKVETPLFDAARLNLSDGEKAVLGSFDGEPVHVEEVIRACGRGAGEVNSALISLRLKGLVKQLPGNVFVKK